MNLQELIEKAAAQDPALAEKFRSMAPEGQTDFSQVQVSVKFRLEKFDGDYEPGKQPVEVIEGGDDLETLITVTNEAEEA